MHFLTKQIRTDRTSHPRRLFFFRFKVICEFYCCQRLVGKQQNSFLTIMGSHLKVGNNFGFLPMRHNGKFITSLSDIEGSIPPSQVTAMILILQFNFLILRKNWSWHFSNVKTSRRIWRSSKLRSKLVFFRSKLVLSGLC